MDTLAGLQEEERTSSIIGVVFHIKLSIIKTNNSATAAAATAATITTTTTTTTTTEIAVG